MLIDVLICFGLPLLVIAFLSRKYGKVIKPFFIGMAAFTVSQVLIRIPILSLVLPNFTWYLILQANTYLYGIFLGLTAGIFEEVARLLFLKLLLKGRTRLADGLAFGLGHGGIEAVLFVGFNCIATMVLYPLGMVDLTGTGNLAILTGGIERIFAMTFHIGASLIILYGIREQKAVRYTLLAVVLHTIVDSMAIILPAATGLGTAGLELFVMVASALVLGFSLGLFFKKVKS